MIQCPEWSIHRGSVCAEWADIVALRLEVRVRGGVIGKRGEGLDLFSMSARVGGMFVEEVDIGGGGAKEGMPGEISEASLGWGGSNKVCVL